MNDTEFRKAMGMCPSSLARNLAYLVAAATVVFGSLAVMNGCGSEVNGGVGQPHGCDVCFHADTDAGDAQ